MTVKFVNRTLAVSLLSVVSLVSLSQIPAQAAQFQLNFIGQHITPSATTFNNTEIGGLSGITYDPVNNQYYSISDDRGNRTDNLPSGVPDNDLSRFYTLEIDLSSGQLQQGGVTFTDVTQIFQSGGIPFPSGELDPEAIALTNNNSVYISSEGDTSQLVNPFINEFSLTTGQQISALPIDTKFLPDTNSGVRNNKGFESTTITPNQSFLFSATEEALEQDGPVATLNNGSPARILQYDLANDTAIGEFLYNTDPIALSPNPPNSFATNGLVELLALDDTGLNLLALERSFSVGAEGTPGDTGNTVKLYQVSLAGATDISGFNSIDGVTGIVPVQKSLLLDLTDLGIPIDNVEGITFGATLPNGNSSLILVSDNNFSSFQFTQVLAFEVETVPEPSALLGLGLLGIGGIVGRICQRK